MPSILIVEDEEIISEPFSIVLNASGYNVTIARNGKEALKLCSKKTFELILLDLMMPVMDGVEFLRQANLKETSPETKVVVLSNLAMGGEIIQALKLGAEENILKASITPISLRQLVGQYLNTDEVITA